MLELNKNYSIKEIGDLKDFVTVAYIIIDDIYQKITPTNIKNRRNINDSILSDSEIITKLYILYSTFGMNFLFKFLKT